MIEKLPPFFERETYKDFPHSHIYAVLIGLILTIIFIVAYFSVRKKFLKISGRFNSIEFSIKNLSQDNVNSFLNKLSIESENQKKEKE